MNYRTKTTAGFGTNPYLAIDDYALVDLRVGIQDPDKKWSVQVFGHNVTNAYYWTNVAKFNDTVRRLAGRSEEHTSELQSLMRSSYAVFCLKKKKKKYKQDKNRHQKT